MSETSSHVRKFITDYEPVGNHFIGVSNFNRRLDIVCFGFDWVLGRINTVQIIQRRPYIGKCELDRE